MCLNVDIDLMCVSSVVLRSPVNRRSLLASLLLPTKLVRIGRATLSLHSVDIWTILTTLLNVATANTRFVVSVSVECTKLIESQRGDEFFLPLNIRFENRWRDVWIFFCFFGKDDHVLVVLD